MHLLRVTDWYCFIEDLVFADASGSAPTTTIYGLAGANWL